MSGRPPLLKAAINGSRAPGEHPALPRNETELAAEAVAAAAAGAGAIHLHVLDRDGAESLAAGDVARTIAVVRDRLRSAGLGVPIGVSTGLWIVGGDPRWRQTVVAAWREPRPDFVSLNYSEAGAAELARALERQEVAIEAGLSDAASAEILIGAGPVPGLFRILLEPQEQEPAAALNTVAAIERILRRSRDGGLRGLPRLLHGSERTAWSGVEEAARRGLATRIGLEDTLLLPDGSPAAGNAELVSAALRMVAARGAAG